MFEFGSIKHLINKLIKKKEVESDQRKKDTDKPTNYVYLSNAVDYRYASVYKKIWYLRGRFDWFDNLTFTDEKVAEEMVDMLQEIVAELDNIAFSFFPEMDVVMSILNLKHDVLSYYIQYVENINMDKDYVSIDWKDPNPTSYELLWIYRAIFEEAKAEQNVKTMYEICMILGQIQKALPNTQKNDKKAIKDIVSNIMAEAERILDSKKNK